MISNGSVVHVVDDEPRLLKALSRLLGAEGFSVRAFASAPEFLAEYCATDVGCLVLDVAMPGLDGFELQQRLTHAGVLLPIIFLTGHGDIPMSVRAIKAGAVDFLTKPVNDADLIHAVKSALQLAKTWNTERTVTGELSARYDTLTAREREVMSQVIVGKLNKQIAADLGTGEQNIKVHRGRVMSKMGVESLADLVRAGERLGLGRPLAI
jgi:FixJ family two-component response regulator